MLLPLHLPLHLPLRSLRVDPARLAGVAITVLAHAAMVLFLFTYAPARETLRAIAPLMVDLIKPEQPAPPAAAPQIEQQPKPLPVKRVPPQTVQELPILAAQTVAPVEVPAVMQSESKPAPPVVRALEARPAAPGPLISPSFNANYLDNPAPAYPALSRRMGEQGRVLLRVFVEADGVPSKFETRSSSGHERLDHAALEAVRRWKFVPAKQGDQAVAAWVVVPILFNLKG